MVKVKEIVESFVVIWRARCFLNTEEGESFIIIDNGDDPYFFCEVCNIEWIHLPPSNRRKDNHSLELVGRVTYKQLEELASKDKRGW